MDFYIILALVAFIAIKVYLEFFYHVALISPATYTKKAVFISGCDMGFGEHAALALDKLGFKVFAGCLTKDGAEKLKNNASSKLVTIQMDITKAEDVDNAAKVITAAAPKGLWAVINNAGIGIGGPIEWLPMVDYRRVIEVNYLGHVAVTKALLPLVQKTGGRIVNTCSMAGVIAAPHMSAYAASKFALEAFSDVLRCEMIAFGVDVVVIEPTFMNTAMVTHGFAYIDKLWSELGSETKDIYGSQYYQNSVAVGKQVSKTVEPLAKVVSVYVQSVTLKHPKSRYRVGRGTTIIPILFAILPTRIIDWILAKPISSVAYKRPLE